MIDFIANWCQGIVISVVIATVIEMIVPNSSNKKYIKVVIGLFVLFNIVSPIINKVAGKDLMLESLIDFKSYAKEIELKDVNSNSLSTENNSRIKDIYIMNLKKDIKSKLGEKGYNISSINIDVKENNEYSISKISINLYKEEKNNKGNKEDTEEIRQINEVTEVNEVNIIIGNYIQEQNEDNKIIENNLSKKQESEIRDFIRTTYNIKDSQIYLNGKGG